MNQLNDYAASSAAATGAAAGSAAYTSAYTAAATSMTGAAVGGATAGFTSGFLGSNGDINAGFKGAAVGGATGAAFNYVGDVAPNGIGNVAGHAAVGCASAVAGSGGGCGAGALSAAAGSAWTQYGVRMDSFTANLITNSVVGGTASVLGGGKFSNGATTAAYGYLFNHMLHIGGSARVPILGGGSASVGVSYNNSEWDLGIIIENDVPGIGVNKMLTKGTLDVGYQTGDFKTNAGESSVNYQAGAGGYGLNLQTNGGQGGFGGAALSVGPQVGVSVGGQVTRTISVRTHLLPLIDRAKSLMGRSQ